MIFEHSFSCHIVCRRPSSFIFPLRYATCRTIFRFCPNSLVFCTLRSRITRESFYFAKFVLNVDCLFTIYSTRIVHLNNNIIITALLHNNYIAQFLIQTGAKRKKMVAVSCKMDENKKRCCSLRRKCVILQLKMISLRRNFGSITSVI